MILSKTQSSFGKSSEKVFKVFNNKHVSKTILIVEKMFIKKKLGSKKYYFENPAKTNTNSPLGGFCRK